MTKWGTILLMKNSNWFLFWQKKADLELGVTPSIIGGHLRTEEYI